MGFSPSVAITTHPSELESVDAVGRKRDQLRSKLCSGSKCAVFDLSAALFPRGISSLHSHPKVSCFVIIGMWICKPQVTDPVL